MAREWTQVLKERDLQKRPLRALVSQRRDARVKIGVA